MHDIDEAIAKLQLVARDWLVECDYDSKELSINRAQALIDTQRVLDSLITLRETLDRIR